jgi:hypothetical protein
LELTDQPADRKEAKRCIPGLPASDWGTTILADARAKSAFTRFAIRAGCDLISTTLGN